MTDKWKKFQVRNRVQWNLKSETEKNRIWDKEMHVLKDGDDCFETTDVHHENDDVIEVVDSDLKPLSVPLDGLGIQELSPASECYFIP